MGQHVSEAYNMAVEGGNAAPSTPPGTQNIGFLTIVQENNAYLGGYLVTNLWGRPLEFRLSTAVQPNRIQHILYGGTLQGYLYADLIGKTLVEKTSTCAQCIFTDCEPVLDLRLSMDVPVVCLGLHPQVEGADSHSEVNPEPGVANLKNSVLCHPRFAADRVLIGELLDRLDGGLDLAEPFVRIREAISEARKLGVTSRN
jgi:hypothetical protein